MSELSSGARDILRMASGADEPSAQDRDRVRAAVLAQVGGPMTPPDGGSAAGGGSAAAGSLAGSSQGAVGSKLALAVLMLGGAAVFIIAPWSEPGPAPTVTRSSPRADELAVPARHEGPASERALDAEAVASLVAPVPPPQDATEAPHRDARVTRSVAPQKERTPPVADHEQPESAERPKEAALPPLVDVSREPALLRRARTSLRRGDTADALAALAEHEREFPRGALVPERQLLEVLVMCSAGQREEARRRAVAFRERHPGSPHLQRLETTCAAR